jgi:uncharacterized Rossmann fold enzyme
MEYSRWAPRYRRLAEEFGFPFAREEAAAELLTGLLPAEAKRAPAERLRRRIEGRTAIVVGLAPGAGHPPLGRLSPALRPLVLIAADGATARLLDGGSVPDLIVTDLDGPIPSEITANASGALAVIHAHGDNVESLRRWVPEFPGEIVGSWAGPPTEALVDPGGFTDGDRAGYLAAAFGARRILLHGFDFRHAEEPTLEGEVRKRKKLGWAERLLHELARDPGSPPMAWLTPDGRQVPLQVAGTPEEPTGPSTQ